MLHHDGGASFHSGGHEVLLAASGPLVHDGYNYMLLIHGPSNAAYVVQLGGFAGSQTVFGPIALTATCQ
jgi:hypothetical protein